MAKSTTGKRDPQDTQTSERRRSTGAAQNGADEAATPPARARRKPAARRAVSEETVQRQASAEPTDSPTGELPAKRYVDVPHEHIAVRAYHIYLERGGRAGEDFEDWITAERELRERAAGQRAR